jgi:cyclophilin family peptidyl-prolyl cis-trans isomerase/HEAT repeat protein
MNRRSFVSLVFVLCLSIAAIGQVPVDVHVKILKAEDARRWDAELEKLISGNAAEPVVVRAMLAAGRIGDERAVPVLSQRLRSGSPNVAAMAAFALGEIESIAAADAILQRIGETGSAQGTFNNRGRLAEAAGKIAAANAKHEKAKQLSDAIVFVLAAEKERPTSVETIRLALTSALRARPAGAEENLRFFLSHTDPGVVGDALNTLSRMRAKNANRDARELLATHTHAVVRANAARVLGAAEDNKEAVDLLIKAATSDTDSRVRVSAIRALGSLKEAKAADALLARGEALVAAYKKNFKPNFNPAEQSEFVEISNALAQILAKTGNERADALFKDFAKVDQFRTTEPYIARVKVGRLRPGAGAGNDAPPPTEYRQFVTIVQVMGELASYESESAEGKKIKAEAPEQMRKLATALSNADASKEPLAVMAAPDALRAFAKFKTDDLESVLRESLSSQDVFVRATAAELLAENFPSQTTRRALVNAFEKALETDKNDNDAQLALLDAMGKADKAGAVDTIYKALDSPDYLVRKKAFELLDDPKLLVEYPGAANVARDARTRNRDKVLPYDPKTGTKLGQMLSTDADYRRALSRRNGKVRAVLTTQKGVFTIDLLPEDAPLTVDNFVKLARSGYFNGLEVHRVVPNFVMQDGDPRGDGNGGPGWSIRCEINMVPFERGAVGMALSGKDTGGSQWFVTHSPQPHLDGGYTVFGRVNEKDMAVVDKIVRGDKIVSVRIVEGGAAPRATKRK